MSPKVLKPLSGFAGLPSPNIAGYIVCRIRPLYFAHRFAQSQVNAHLQVQAVPWRICGHCASESWMIEVLLPELTV